MIAGDGCRVGTAFACAGAGDDRPDAMDMVSGRSPSARSPATAKAGTLFRHVLGLKIARGALGLSRR
jgi:hypothetical protein